MRAVVNQPGTEDVSDLRGEVFTTKMALSLRAALDQDFLRLVTFHGMGILLI